MAKRRERIERDLLGRPLRSSPLVNADHDPNDYLRLRCPLCGGPAAEPLRRSVIRTAIGGFIVYSCPNCLHEGNPDAQLVVPHGDRLRALSLEQP